MNNGSRDKDSNPELAEGRGQRGKGRGLSVRGGSYI